MPENTPVEEKEVKFAEIDHTCFPQGRPQHILYMNGALCRNPNATGKVDARWRYCPVYRGQNHRR